MNTFLVDLVTGAQISNTLPAQTISSNTTTKGTAVDMQPTDGPVHGLYVTGDCGDASTQIVIKLQESVDTTDGNFTDITGAVVTLAGSATANDNLAAVLRAPFRTKRYMRATVATSGGTASVPIAVALIGRKKITGTGAGVQL